MHALEGFLFYRYRLNDYVRLSVYNCDILIKKPSDIKQEEEYSLFSRSIVRIFEGGFKRGIIIGIFFSVSVYCRCYYHLILALKIAARLPIVI